MFGIIVGLAILLSVNPCKGQDKDYARNIIEVLSSPEFKGRGYVQKGHRIAASFISQEFSKTGLEGFVTGKGFENQFLQTFPIRINTFPSKMELAIDGRSLDPGIEFLVHPVSASCKGNYRLYVIEKSQLTEPDAVTKIIRETRGKFVMIDARDNTKSDKESLKKAGDLIEIISFSKRIPSAGTIIVTNDKLTWSISKYRATKPVVTVNSRKIGDKPIEIHLNIKSVISKHQTSNVAGYIPGTGCPDSFIFIIAHYDHLGMMGNEVYFPGANDNASGVSMLLSLAKYFKENPHRYTMVFVALAAEESGLDGARFFADHSPVDLNKTVFLLNFDLAGTGDEGIKVVNATEHKDNFKLLVDLNTRSGYLNDVQSRGPACNSDHCVFHERGVPCFFIYTLGGSASYHDIYDKPDSLTLTEFSDYQKLIIKFLQNVKHSK